MLSRGTTSARRASPAEQQVVRKKPVQILEQHLSFPQHSSMPRGKAGCSLAPGKDRSNGILSDGAAGIDMSRRQAETHGRASATAKRKPHQHSTKLCCSARRPPCVERGRGGQRQVGRACATANVNQRKPPETGFANGQTLIEPCLSAHQHARKPATEFSLTEKLLRKFSMLDTLKEFGEL